MKAAFCLLVLTTFAIADEISDRAGIARTIAALNESPPRIEAVAESPAAADEIRGLLARAQPRPADSRPGVNISHEPWGEATIGPPAFENSKIVAGATRFLTPDVALVDAGVTRADNAILYRPALFVMKKVGTGWKIAAARALAPR